MTPKHIVELQSLRGLAALCVAGHHFFMAYELGRPLRLSIDSVFNAHAAVILFYVLSGYVLGQSLERSGVGGTQLVAYYVRRLSRIFPAVWAVSALALAIILAVGAGPLYPAPSSWFTSYMKPVDVSPARIVLALLALNSLLIVPIGTIFTELVGSFFLPFFKRLVERRGWVMVGLLAALVGVTVLTHGAPHRLDTLGYLVYFALGLSIAAVPEPAQAWIRTRAAPIALTAAVVLVFFRMGWFWAVTGSLQPLTYDYSAVVPSLVEGLAGAALVAALVALRGRYRWLSAGPITSLGDISYSLYLLHFPMLVLTAHLLAPVFFSHSVGGLTASVAVFIIGIGATLVLSTIIYRFVEMPGITLGKRLTAHRTYPSWRIPVDG